MNKKNVFKRAFDATLDMLSAKSNTPKIDPNYKIKYDESMEELMGLGLVSEEGVVIDRTEYNKYMAVIERRRSIRELPDFEELKKAGIVSEKGEVLDDKRFQKYMIKMQDLHMMKYNNSHEL